MTRPGERPESQEHARTAAVEAPAEVSATAAGAGEAVASQGDDESSSTGHAREDVGEPPQPVPASALTPEMPPAPGAGAPGATGAGPAPPAGAGGAPATVADGPDAPVSVAPARGEEPQAEEPRVEEPPAEESRVEQPPAEEPRAEESRVEQPQVEEAQVEQPQAEEARAEQPPAEEPRAEQPPAEEPQVEQPDLHLAPEASGPGEARQLGDREDQASGAVPVEAASPHAVQAAGEVASAAVDAPAHGSGSRAADGPPDTALPAPGGPPATTAAAPTGAPHTPAGGTGNGTASDTGSDTASDTAAGITPAVDSGVDSGVDSDAGGQRRRGWRQLLPLAVLGLVLLLMLGLTGWLGWQLRQDAATETARTKGLTAARDAARVLFSYDYQQLDKDFAAGLAVTTGSARDEYQRTTSSLVRPVAVQYQAVVKADVREAGVIEASPGHVLTMIFLNQTTTSTRVQGPKIDQNRVRLGLRLVGGKWLVDRVEGPL